MNRQSIEPKPHAGAPFSRPRRSRLRRVAGWLTVIVVLAAVIGAAIWFWPARHQPVRQGRFAGAGPMTVATAVVQSGDIPHSLQALGTVTPLATVTVKTQIAGRITRLGFQEGQYVNAGDFLAEIDPRPYQIALDQAEGQLLRDQALLKNAETDLARYRRLFAQDSIAKQTLDTQENLVLQYRGTVRYDQAVVDSAKLNLAYCHITAPISGRIGLRQVDIGNYVTAGDATGIAVITQMKPITVVFSIPENALATVVKRFNAADNDMTVLAYDSTRSKLLARGKLTTIDNQIDTSTGTVKLRAEFANDDESFFPNQFVNVELIVEVLRSVPIVPTAAVQRGVPGTYVYVVNADDTVSVRPVKLGIVDGDRTSIESGLEPGTRVVTDGTDRLRDGAKVVVAELAGRNPPGQNRVGGQQPRKTQ
ncbi:MAG TPA: MdtA/MuxA family multidrug efflux RND transporter periplasmic adaptor subunit [Ferrovibrio sp.]|uniref:MdtA/MuxA family multidrug efflux RND transporter periplasmic adaptor subunit n=1 Tax=Ferrovibrio sp. TaxID=1917215 RepID=UPI002ED26AE6